MDERLIGIFIKEINTQARFALFAFNNIQFSKSNLNIEMGNHHEPYFFIHNFLSHSANISKILWPDPRQEKLKLRGETLRNELEMQNNSYIKRRRFRNHLEHYDERIDNWYDNSNQKSMVDFYTIDNKSAIVGLNDEDYFRGFNPSEMILYFHGQEYRLMDLLKDVEHIFLKSKDKLQHHW